eukprot:1150320-Pelagomonas_calceolata.AAC.1
MTRVLLPVDGKLSLGSACATTLSADDAVLLLMREAAAGTGWGCALLEGVSLSACCFPVKSCIAACITQVEK